MLPLPRETCNLIFLVEFHSNKFIYPNNQVKLSFRSIIRLNTSWVGLCRLGNIHPRSLLDMLSIPSSITFSQVERIAKRDVFISKKYALSLHLLVIALTSWRSIPDAMLMVKQAITNWKDEKYLVLLYMSSLRFVKMSLKFFVRRFLILIICARWGKELHYTVTGQHNMLFIEEF